MKHQIKRRFTDAVLFEAELHDDTHSGLVVRLALEKAVSAGASLAGAKIKTRQGLRYTLVGDRPLLMIGPIGSRCDYLTAYFTDGPIVIKAGCFTGTLQDFGHAVIETHGAGIHGAEYQAAVALIEAHAQLWTPERGGDVA